MFVSDKVVFAELHKTGGSHILRCLEELLEGQVIGKHNLIPASLHQRFILGSVRNPWDWYVSLWAYGCGRKGAVYHRTTTRFNHDYYLRQRKKNMGKSWFLPSRLGKQLLSDCSKPVEAWRNAYTDSQDPACFQQWLKLVLDRERRFDIGDGFGFSPISHTQGLMTFRYFKLFTDLESQLYLDDNLADPGNLKSIWAEHHITDHIIRNEFLENDLIVGLERAGVQLTAQQKMFLNYGKKNKTNTSKRQETAFYYDQSSIDLVREKEIFLIEKHNYTPPNR